MSRLPKGYFPMDWTDWDSSSNNDAEIEQKLLTKRCTCGTVITYGPDVPLEWHQPYCDLVRKDDPSKDSKE